MIGNGYEQFMTDFDLNGVGEVVSNMFNGKQIGAGMLTMLAGVLFYHFVLREPLLKFVTSNTALDRSFVEGIEDSIETAVLLSLDGKAGSIPYHSVGLACYYYLIRMN